MEPEIVNERKLNSPLDWSDYRDEGCELSRSCLRCPLARCVHDEPWGKRRWLMRLRARKVSRLFAQGKRVKELALIFGISPRTVRRDLKENTKHPKMSLRDPDSIGAKQSL